MRKILTLIFALALSLAVSAQTLPHQSAELVITPGVSAGPIKLGQPLPNDIDQLLGSPTKMTEGMVLWSVSDALYFEEGVMVKLDESGRVRAIYVATQGAKTNRGAAIRDSMSKLKKAHPDAKYVPHRGYNSLDVPGLEIMLTVKDQAAQFFITSR